MKSTFRKGDKFVIDWDKLISETTNLESRQYLQKQRERYKNTIFTATSVYKGVGVSGYIITHAFPDRTDFGGIGECYAVKTISTSPILTTNETKIAELKKKISKLRGHINNCHRNKAGIFCGFCDSAECQIDTLKEEIKKLRNEDKCQNTKSK